MLRFAGSVPTPSQSRKTYLVGPSPKKRQNGRERSPGKRLERQVRVAGCGRTRGPEQAGPRVRSGSMLPTPGVVVYEQPLVVPQEPQTKQEPAGCIEIPHV